MSAAQPIDRGYSEKRDSALYTRFAALIRDEIGVRLPANKQLMVESRLRRRMLAMGFTQAEDYFRYLFVDGGFDAERDIIFDAVTTNKTDFFREKSHFDVLTQTVLPEARRRRAGRGPVKIWSAAASTGAEAYTISMVAQTCAEEGPAFHWAILGTDINLEVLDRARNAIYATDVIAPVPDRYRDRFLMQGQGPQAGHWRIVPELRRRIRFEQMNLMDDSYRVDRDIDAIFLRNVLIYFGPEDQARVIANMADHLSTGGHLFVGHSESMVVRNPKFTQIAPAVFVRI